MRFQLSTGTPEPIYAQIVRQVRAALAGGTLKPGARLPSVRALARELLVNPNTVQKAYAALERDGLVHSRRGAGTFVAEHSNSTLSLAAKKKRLAPLIDTLLTEAVHLGLSEEQLLAELRKRSRSYKFSGEHKP